MRWCILVFFVFVFCANSFAQSGIVYIWSGGVTDSSARITVQLQTPSNTLQFLLDTNASFSNVFQTNYLPPDSSNNNIYSATINALLPNTKYYYTVLNNGVLVPNAVSYFTTAWYQPLSFSFAIGSCSSSGNHAVYSVIDSLHPRFFIFTGDLHYLDPNSANINTHRIPYTITLSQPAIKNFLHHTPIAYVWDDHDFAGNNSDGNAIGKHSAYVAYRQCVPHYPLALNGIDSAIYQSFDYGRLHFIITDLRSERVMFQNIMSAQQLNWLKAELLLAKQKKQIAVWISSVSFTGVAQLDNWAEFAAERTNLSNFLRDSAIANLLILSGDAHMIAIDNGINNHYEVGEINHHQYPIFQAAALNRAGSIKGGTFSNGVFPNPSSETGQFGLVDVVDNGGDSICITLSGIRTDSLGQNTSIITSYSFCRNVASDIISTKNIVTQNMPSILTTVNEFGILSITNNSLQTIENIVVSDAIGKQLFVQKNLPPIQTVSTALTANHGVVLLFATFNGATIVKKIFW